MKKRILGVALLAISCMAVVLISWSARWVLLHGWTAAIYAEQILANNPVHEDRFIDYTIYTTKGCVAFATHEEDRTMVYCPHGAPTDTAQVGPLAHVVGRWYRVKYNPRKADFAVGRQ